MKTRSVRREIFAGFAVLVLALALVGGYTLWRQARTIHSLRLQNQGYLPLSLVLGRASNTQTAMARELEGLIEQRDRAVSRTHILGVRRTRRAVLLSARGLAKSALPDAQGEDAALLRRVDSALAEVERAFRDDERSFNVLFDALAAGDAARARAVRAPLLEREIAVADVLAELTRTVEGRMRALADEAAHEQDRTLHVLLVAMVVALAVGLATTLSARRALRPLALLIERVRAVARGDLSPRALPARPDEIGELAREFDKMVEAVKARDTELRDKAEAIRAAEQHLEQVVATLRAAVMVVSADGRVRSANPAARVLAHGTELIGRAFADTPFGLVPEIAAAVGEICAGRSSSASLLAVAAGERTLDVAVVTFESPGEPAGALFVAEDVTEREQARARLLQNERLAAIGRMAAHVTHEVRNPLSSMALNAEMLADEARALGEVGREVERLVGAIQREIDRLTGITEEYLRVARLPQPRLECEDIGALVAEALAFVAPELERAGIALRVEVDPAAGAAMLDEAQIRQALLNLFRNAREALEGVTGRSRALFVRVTPALGGARSEPGFEIAIADSGPGISPEVRARLFELFVTTKERGSGLGLPLTREIVLAHGGTIEAAAATPEEGGGAKFVIWLPAAPARDAPPRVGGEQDAA